MMFERFTEKAIKVIMLAQEEARRMGHNFVGTEQILLGLIGEGTGIAAKTLKSMGVNLKDARVEVEKIIGRGSGFVVLEIPFTPRGKQLIELAWEQARSFNHNFIGTEHLLLGLIREGEGVGVRALEELGVDFTTLRTKVLRLMGEEELIPKDKIEAYAQLVIKNPGHEPLTIGALSQLTSSTRIADGIQLTINGNTITMIESSASEAAIEMVNELLIDNEKLTEEVSELKMELVRLNGLMAEENKKAFIAALSPPDTEELEILRKDNEVLKGVIKALVSGKLGVMPLEITGKEAQASG